MNILRSESVMAVQVHSNEEEYHLNQEHHLVSVN